MYYNYNVLYLLGECRVKKVVHVLIVCICILSLYGTSAMAADLDEKGRVLFISSYSYSWDTVQMQIEGIKDTLGTGYTLDYEFMDTKRVNDGASKKMFYESLAYRLSRGEPYDVVIVGDDAALQFALQYREILFQNVPIVFEGINDEELVEKALEDPLITGVVEKLQLEKNIDLALELIPDATKVIAILDDTVTGQAERKRFYSAKKQYPQLSFEELNCSKLTEKSIIRSLNAMSEDTILIFVVMTEDADGNKYSSQQIGAFMERYSSVPVFRMVEAGIGSGLLGGNVVSMYRSGEEAANMAKRIMAGERVSMVKPLLESPTEVILDENILRKYEMNLRKIPKETVLLNHEKSFWERNEESGKIILVLIFGIVSIITVVSIDWYRKRKVVKELREAKRILENASQHDFLTGLSNRNKFMEDLGRLIESNTPCTVLMLDIDDFKHINDTYGHSAGDITLQEIANRMKEMQSQILTPYRYAGDEFIMILRSTQPQLVEKTAYACRNVFTKEVKFSNVKYKVTGSIGVASYPKDAINVETLITRADDAMYEVKKSGKNMFAYYTYKAVSQENE